jgi:hypothetical protein
MFSIYSPSPLIAGIACLESFRSITEPPWRKIERNTWDSFPNSFLLQIYNEIFVNTKSLQWYRTYFDD